MLAGGHFRRVGGRGLALARVMTIHPSKLYIIHHVRYTLELGTESHVTTCKLSFLCQEINSICITHIPMLSLSQSMELSTIVPIPSLIVGRCKRHRINLCRGPPYSARPWCKRIDKMRRHAADIHYRAKYLPLLT